MACFHHTKPGRFVNHTLTIADLPSDPIRDKDQTMFSASNFPISCRLLATACFLSASLALAAPLARESGPNPEDRRFFENPHEAKERPLREQAYREFYEEELEGQLSDDQILQRVFAPRVYDESFDTGLPGRQTEGQLSLSLSPKFSDVIREEFIRLPVEITYDFSNWFQVFSEVGTYFGNPFDSGHDSGVYNWRLGGKYSWTDVAGSGFNVAIGGKADMPLSDPPPELTDGFARYEPYVSISRRLDRHPEWLVYLNLAYQIVDDTPFRADPVSPQPSDQQFLRPGAIYYPGGRFRYSVELEYRTNVLDFRNDYVPVDSIPDPLPENSRYANWVLASEDVHELIARPAITWFPTRKIREGLIIPGNWEIGVRLEVPVVEETGEDFGISVRFRWYYDYRKFIADDLRRFLRRFNNN